MKPERIGDLYAILCALLCGLGNITVKVGLANVSPELFILFFFVVAFLLTLFSLINRKNRIEIFRSSFRSILLVFILTIFFSCGIYTFILSMKLIDPATVSFISRIEIVFTIFLAYLLLKERLNKYEIIGGLIAILGVLFLKFTTTLEISEAATLMIISAGFFASAEIMVKKYVDLIGTVRFVFFRNLFAIPMFLTILLIRQKEVYLPDNQTILMAVLTALLLPIFGRITYIQALRRISISRTALITQAIPLFTALFAFVMLNTIPTPKEWLGGILIVIGVMIVRMSGMRFLKRTQSPPAKPPI